MKKCCICQTPKPLDDFNKNKSKTDGLSNLCRPCDNDRARSYYQQNKSRMVKQIHAAAKRRAGKIKFWVCEYLAENPCIDCGETDIRVLEFDHQRDKEFNVSAMLTGDFGLTVVEAEIAKCEVVCANCHKRRTDSSFDNYRQQYLDGRLLQCHVAQ